MWSLAPLRIGRLLGNLVVPTTSQAALGCRGYSTGWPVSEGRDRPSSIAAGQMAGRGVSHCALQGSTSVLLRCGECLHLQAGKNPVRLVRKGIHDQYSVEILTILEIFGEKVPAAGPLSRGDNQGVPILHTESPFHRPSTVQQCRVDGHGTPTHQIPNVRLRVFN